MDEEQLMALCILLMCDDPSSLSDERREKLEDFADQEAKKFGMKDWQDHYNYYE